MKLRSQQMPLPSVTFLQLAFFELRLQWMSERNRSPTTSISTSTTTGPSGEDLGDAGERYWQVLQGDLPHHLPHLPHDLLVHLPHHLSGWYFRPCPAEDMRNEEISISKIYWYLRHRTAEAGVRKGGGEGFSSQKKGWKKKKLEEGAATKMVSICSLQLQLLINHHPV